MAKQPDKTEVERWREIADKYRDEATRLGTAVIELEAEVQRLLSELADEKAASVPPVEVEAVYVNTSYEVVVCCDGNEWSAQTCADWLRRRVKERSEG